MKICTTKTRLTEEEALQLASRDNSGLIGTFFNKLGHVPKEVSVLQIRKFYYPYYLEAAEAKLLRAAGLPTRRVVYTVAMEGGFGTVQQMKGVRRPLMRRWIPPQWSCARSTRRAPMPT